MPKTERDWVQYQNELAKWVLKVASFGDGTITTSTGTQVDGLDEIPGAVHLGDGSIKTTGEVQVDGLGEMPGIVPSEQSLPMVSTGNVSSTQDTTTPLSASDGGASATISVASHGLDMSSGLVTYNAGSITGLAYSTKYYVYAIDPTYAGGAVTYLASTDKTDLVSNVGTYYVDTMTTGTQAASGNISAITKGSPTTFTTSSAHGFFTGYTVGIADIVDDGGGGSDMQALFNGNDYVVIVTNTTNFTVAVDSSSLVAVWVSGGSATYVGTSPIGDGGGGGGYIP
jgi:hypothetical protein